MSYFDTRSAGQTVARVRELETIRAFLTGQGLFSVIDLLFTFVFVGVMFAYSARLTLIVLLGLPLYVLIGFLVRPPLRDLVNEKFNRGAASQQFLVETVVGIGTIKAAAVEPIMRAQWEEKLAAYVKTGFSATMLGSGGQRAIQYVSKLTTAALLLFGAKAVIDGELSVGALVAFNMIASQAVQPVLRLSQIWQDFQQVQISIERLGDILNAQLEPAPLMRMAPPTPTAQERGAPLCCALFGVTSTARGALPGGRLGRRDGCRGRTKGWDEGQAATASTACSGSKVVWLLSMAQATASRRSATLRRARPWL